MSNHNTFLEELQDFAFNAKQWQTSPQKFSEKSIEMEFLGLFKKFLQEKYSSSNTAYCNPFRCDGMFEINDTLNNKKYNIIIENKFSKDFYNNKNNLYQTLAQALFYVKIMHNNNNLIPAVIVLFDKNGIVVADTEQFLDLLTQETINWGTIASQCFESKDIKKYFRLKKNLEVSFFDLSVLNIAKAFELICHIGENSHLNEETFSVRNYELSANNFIVKDNTQKINTFKNSYFVDELKEITTIEQLMQKIQQIQHAQNQALSNSIDDFNEKVFVQEENSNENTTEVDKALEFNKDMNEETLKYWSNLFGTAILKNPEQLVFVEAGSIQVADIFAKEITKNGLVQKMSLYKATSPAQDHSTPIIIDDFYETENNIKDSVLEKLLETNGTVFVLVKNMKDVKINSDVIKKYVKIFEMEKFFAGETDCEGFMDWMIESAKIVLNEGFVENKVPESVSNSVQKWNEETDVLLSWFDQNFEYDPKSYCLLLDLMDSYNFWCSSQMKNTLTIKPFLDLLKNHSLYQQYSLLYKADTRPLKALEQSIYTNKETGEHRIMNNRASFIQGIKFKS